MNCRCGLPTDERGRCGHCDTSPPAHIRQHRYDIVAMNRLPHPTGAEKIGLAVTAPKPCPSCGSNLVADPDGPWCPRALCTFNARTENTQWTN